jgi:hypothetical protein
VARQSCRKMRTTMKTRMNASMRVSRTAFIDSWTNTVGS